MEWTEIGIAATVAVFLAHPWIGRNQQIPQYVLCKPIPNSASMSSYRKLELYYCHRVGGWEYGMISALGTLVIPMSFQATGTVAGASRE